MPRVKTMIQLIDIVSRIRANQSNRCIHNETGTHREVIRKLRVLSLENRWLDTSKALPTESEMNRIYSRTSQTQQKPHPLDAYEQDIKQYLENKYSFVVIHKMISQKIKCSETTVRRYIQRKYPQKPKSVMLRQLEDGIMEVDFGYLGLVYDLMESRLKKAWVFSGRLRKSRKAYREVVFDQKNETFFGCNIRAFHHFGGVPKKAVPDNLKSAVVKAAFYDPVINRSYIDLAKHYGFMISPCLPEKPQHKGGVENDIKYIKRNFWPVFVEEQKLKGYDRPRSQDIQIELNRWDEETADIREIKGVGQSPAELFIDEKKILLPLPLEDWNMVVWKECVVRPEWLIQFDNAYYSVPYKYIGMKVMVSGCSGSVSVYYEYELIARHDRARRKWEYKRNPLHAPAEKEEYLNMSSESILAWAGNIGKYTLEVIRKVLEQKNIDGLRPSRGILSLSKKFSPGRLEAACRRALHYDVPEYRKVLNILEKGLDREVLPEENISVAQEYLPFRFTRNPNIYRN